MRYITNQVKVEAMQYTGGNWREIADWIGYEKILLLETYPPSLEVLTQNGYEIADPGYYIIKSADGRILSPCDPYAFNDLYTGVDE